MPLINNFTILNKNNPNLANACTISICSFYVNYIKCMCYLIRTLVVMDIVEKCRLCGHGCYPNSVLASSLLCNATATY